MRKMRLMIALIGSTFLAVSCRNQEPRQNGENNDMTDTNLQHDTSDINQTESSNPIDRAPDLNTVSDIEQSTDTIIKAANPLIWADVPDPDVIRVGEYYYMVSTTMHLSPGVPIMRSNDLANWELISYVYDELSDHESYQLTNGKNIYGRGSWAASLRYNEGVFYVCFASLDRGVTYIYQTKDIEKGEWTRVVLPELFHDPSLLFDEEGKVYIVHGNGTIRIRELKEDLSTTKPEGVNQILVNNVSEDNILNGEGSHFYKINGSYYLFLIEWPRNGRRRELCFRSDTLLGEYEEKVLLDDNFGYGNNGVAQGGIVDTPEGEWFAVLFQDHGAVGRIPMLVPVTWSEGWPLMGVDGKVPKSIDLLSNLTIKTNIVTEDEFEYQEDKLKLQWQWNHNPDNSLWSVIERPGYLRLTTGSIAPNILAARNTLSQRTQGPLFTCETKLDTSGMKPGDYAGIAAFQSGYGMLGVKVMEEGRKYLITASNDGTGNPKEEDLMPLEQEQIYLKVNFFFNVGDIKRLTVIDKAYFYYSLDGEVWEKLQYSLPMKYTLDHFMGYRAALFNYATKETGGYADFDYFRLSDTID